MAAGLALGQMDSYLQRRHWVALAAAIVEHFEYCNLARRQSLQVELVAGQSQSELAVGQIFAALAGKGNQLVEGSAPAEQIEELAGTVEPVVALAWPLSSDFARWRRRNLSNLVQGSSKQVYLALRLSLALTPRNLCLKTLC